MATEEKRVVIDTDHQRGRLFKIARGPDGRYFVYRIKVGLLVNRQNKVGEARQLSDAISVAKSSLQETVRNVRVSDW